MINIHRKQAVGIDTTDAMLNCGKKSGVTIVVSEDIKLDVLLNKIEEGQKSLPVLDCQLISSIFNRSRAKCFKCCLCCPSMGEAEDESDSKKV